MSTPILTPRELIACLRIASDREIEQVRDLIARPVRADLHRGPPLARRLNLMAEPVKPEHESDAESDPE